MKAICIDSLQNEVLEMFKVYDVKDHESPAYYCVEINGITFDVGVNRFTVIDESKTYIEYLGDVLEVKRMFDRRGRHFFVDGKGTEFEEDQCNVIYEHMEVAEVPDPNEVIDLDQSKMLLNQEHIISDLNIELSSALKDIEDLKEANAKLIKTINKAIERNKQYKEKIVELVMREDRSNDSV